MKKIIIGGIFAGIAMLVLRVIFGAFTEDLYTMSPIGLFKQMDIMSFVAYDMAVGLILAYAYSILKGSVPASGIQKGIVFGLLIWLVGTLPGIGITYVTMNIRNKLLLAWLISGLINYVAAGAVIQIADEKVK